jgi:hypothetical protein
MKEGSKLMKDNLKSISKYTGDDEEIVFPVFVAGKNSKGDKLIGVFSHGVHT